MILTNKLQLFSTSRGDGHVLGPWVEVLMMQDDHQSRAKKKKKMSHLIIFNPQFIYTKAQSHFQSHFRPNPRLQVLPCSSEQIYGAKWLKSSSFWNGTTP